MSNQEKGWVRLCLAVINQAESDYELCEKYNWQFRGSSLFGQYHISIEEAVTVKPFLEKKNSIYHDVVALYAQMETGYTKNTFSFKE